MFRTVGFDLETSNLSAMMGRILCCSFVNIGADDESDVVWTFRGDDRQYRNRKDITDDGRLVVAIRDELERTADILVGHNSKLFDLKMLNARLAKINERPYVPNWHVDTMWIIRTHFRISSKLVNAQKFFNLADEKTPITWDNWQRAMSGDRAAMDEVVEHCEQDVKVLAQAARHLRPYIRQLKRG